MSINIRTKGQGGEREICDMLNNIYYQVLNGAGLSTPAVLDAPFQRNQLQTAVGGSDIANPFGLEIEVKRQEQLSINTWWKQCVASAQRTGGQPVLIYRQNRKAWRVVIFSNLEIHGEHYITVRAEIEIDAFKDWMFEYLAARI